MLRDLSHWISKRTEALFLSIRTRVILSYLIIVASGFIYLTWKLSADIRPRYLGAEEEIMVDIANVLASAAEQSWDGKELNPTALQSIYDRAQQRKFTAQIYDVTKSSLDLRVYVTDATGKVIFDSDQGKAVGADYSRWNDVHLTLQGKYGSRATPTRQANSETTVLYVAAPIHQEGQIAGVLTVSKPLTRMAMFMDRTRNRIVILGTVAAVGVALMGVLFSAWITYPISNLIAYAKAVRDGRHTALPTLGHSEIRTLGLAFEQMRDALEGKDYVNRYVQTLTHEIKSPIAAIQGAAELLHEEMPAEVRRKFLANIQSETHRIQEATDSLLLLASVESRKSLDHAEEVDLHPLIDRATERLAGRASVKAIRICRDIPGNSGAIVRGDAFLLERTLVNLLENAVAFSPHESSVNVKLHREKQNRRWIVIMEDSGPGVPDYALPRVFERFYSLPRPDTGKKSSGLGLAFVKEVALLHDGSVTLENRTEGGSRAILSLPETD